MPKIVDHDLMRAGILRAAFDLFARRGYDAVTLRDLAQAAGVSTGTLYHYFGSKREVYLALAESLRDHDLGLARAKLERAATPEERFAGYLAFLRENEAHLGQELLLILDYLRQPELADPGLVADILTRFRAAVGAFVGAGDPAQEDPAQEDIAQFVFTFFSGLVLQRMILGERVSFEEQSALLRQALTLLQAERSEP